ncbi:alpha/beta hydrolase [Aldersonia kunmingensis]|uniref:alpha/beta hydrolase n=1 Tax=Aldersonia kunmingensis TaxID=408066 RepID=UPI000A8E27A6
MREAQGGCRSAHDDTAVGPPRRTARLLTWLTMVLALVLVVPLTAALTGSGGVASARFTPTGFDFWVNSSMGPIKSRIFRAADGNTNRVVYALDGMRARNDLNGWEIETDAANALTRANINVVMPVGGESSFYSDWNAPSNFNGQRVTYKWETFITRDLRFALRDRLGFNPNRNGAFGLSMGGSAALALAAYHPDQFVYAGSYSGYLNISAPGMRELMRIAMLDAGGYNIDSMWGPPWNSAWLRNDPFVFAPTLRKNNTRLWISAGSALPGSDDRIGSLLDVYNVVNAMGLESFALLNTRAFQVRMATLGANNVVYSFPAVGIHSWSYWAAELYRMIPDLSAHIG